MKKGGRAPSGQALAVHATPLRVDGPSGFDPSRCETCGKVIVDKCYVSIGPEQVIFCFECCPVSDPKLNGDRVICGTDTLPPEMLPVSDGDADVVVCMGDCGNEPPCALCMIIRPGDDWNAAMEVSR